MAKDDPNERNRPDPNLEIAAADWLFQDDPAAKSPKPAPKPAVSAGAGSGEIFALADGPSSVDLPPPGVVPPVSFEGPSRPAREGKTQRIADQPMLEPSALVEEVWSRTAEWGPNLIVVVGWLGIVLTLVYFAINVGLDQIGIAIFLLGGLAAVLLSYPMLITLERPVRITPEQAVRDYYGALSHHVPHLRRMWLLLSTAGRTSTAYGSYEGFKGYWKDRLNTMRAGHAGAMTPLVFEVADFKADKSAGKVKIDAEYNLKVWVRGQRKAGVIHAIPMKIMLVRGPDKMWYLENGTLGREAHS